MEELNFNLGVFEIKELYSWESYGNIVDEWQGQYQIMVVSDVIVKPLYLYVVNANN